MDSKGAIKRIDSLDYLRGLAALGIMFYHMYLFAYGETDATTVLARVKIYGVIIFYVLSGLTLYKVNIDSFTFTKPVLVDFYIKRFFRIVPLLWLATVLTIIFSYEPTYFTAKKLIANITVILGAFKPETFIAKGAWSIGDEIFFYMLFPFLLWLIKFNKWLFFGFTAFAFVLLCYFTFYKLNPNLRLGEQWAYYVNPLGQVFYFAAGIGLGVVDRAGKFGKWAILAILSVCALVVFYPVSHGDPVMLVTGFNRLILSALVIVLCFLFYKCDFEFLPQIVKTALHTLGAISFSVYLIHPIVHAVLKLLIQSLFEPSAAVTAVLISLTVVITLIVSYYNYVYFEKYFIKRGKMFSLKLSFQ